MLENLLIGALSLVSLDALIAIVVGVAIGIAIGALPGLGPAPAVALLLPLSYYLPPTPALVLLGSVYLAAQYGGSITSITLGIPGEAQSAATIIDGYPITKKGQPGLALTISIIASTAGGLIGIIMLILLSEPLVVFALSFGPTQYFALGVFGLSIVSSLTGGSLSRGLLATALGLFIATIGIDPLVGFPRMTFGNVNLLSGIELVPALLGLFAVSEVFFSAESVITKKVIPAVAKGIQLPDGPTFRRILRPIIQSSGLGVLVGVIPGAGATIASFIAYNETKRFSARPEEFGNGSVEGLAAPEAANNASVGGALIPLLTLGIPGSATTAILLGALTIQGIRPGQDLFTSNAEIVYGLFVALLLANLVMLVFGLFGVKIWARVAGVKHALLMPIVFALSLLGAFSINNSWFDIQILIVFGVIGYVFKKTEIPIAATVIAFVLCPMIEMSFRRALMTSDSGILVFLSNPLSVVLLLLAVITLVYPILGAMLSGRRSSAKKAGSD